MGRKTLLNAQKAMITRKLNIVEKKKTHTDIALVMSDKRKWVYYVSKLFDGSNVDLGLLKVEFPPWLDWFRNVRLLVDLGFVGIEKMYNIKELVIGEKKMKKSKSNPVPKLTDEQKGLNKEVSKERIFVEHAIGGVKIYRILKNRCRLKAMEIKDRILGVCAGLWNYHLSATN